MKKHLSLLMHVLIAAPVFPLTECLAFAGGMEGGGGKGILCQSASGLSVRTLDLWEAENILGFKPIGNPINLDQNLENFGLALWKHRAVRPADFMRPDMPTQIRHLLEGTIIRSFSFIPKGQRLPLTSDATIPPLPPKCEVVQIAIYKPDNSIQVDREYWDRLDAQEKAALVLHEYIYHQARNSGSLDSNESRHVVALIFTGNNPEPMFSPLWSANQYLTCHAEEPQGDHAIPTYQMYAVDETRNGVDGVALYFGELNGVTFSTRTSAFFSELKTQQLKDENFGAASSKAMNSFFNKSWPLTIEGQGNGLVIHVNGETKPKSVGWCSWGRAFTIATQAPNLFYQYNGNYKVIDRDCFYANPDGSCGDNYGSITEVKVEGDADQAQIYTMTLPGYWSPYASFPLKEGSWTDAGGSRTTLTWFRNTNAVGIRAIFDSADYSAAGSLESTARGLKLTFSVGRLGEPGVERPRGILYLAPKYGMRPAN
jgi:hypothetical protein